MVLAPVQVGSNSSIPANVAEKRTAALLNDSVFAAIHDAFLLGASLIELKGRVQVAACNSALDTVTLDKATATFHAGTAAAPPPARGTPKQQPNVINALLNNIVLSTITQGLSAELQDDTWTTSVLRAIFQQIVTLHIKRFPDCTTSNTIYDTLPPPQSVQDLATYPYPYLYPLDDAFDYANVGISSIQGSASSSFTTDFRLYDVTRRALNCLTLLLGDAQESLVPAVIDCYQRRLVRAILANPPVPATEPDCTAIEPPSSDAIKTAVNLLGSQVVRFLEAWDSFLRESFYVDTQHQTSDSQALIIDNEIALAAYEAGRSLASLSWNVSVATAPLENALTPDQENDAAIKDVLATKAQTVWRNTFNDRDINNLQYQITSLSTALDQAYYRVNLDVKRPATDDPLAPPNIDLPSRSLEAVKQSLDYWQRTVTLLCSPGATTIKPALNPSSAPSSPPDGTGANPSAPTMGNVAGQAEKLNWELSKTLRMELIQQVTVWQALILYQQGLQSFSMEVVTQRILNDFMQDVEKAVRDEFTHNRILRRLSQALMIVILLIILLLILAGVMNFQKLSLTTLIQSPVILITAIGALVTPFVTSIMNRLRGFGTMLGVAGTTIEESLQRGYERILIEFDDLNRYVAITYPLIEFFIWEHVEVGGKPIKDGYDFLVNVFWTGSDFAEELKRVARAAFGPISSLIDAQIKVTAAPVEKRAQKS
jgi:lambda repressor-like predicted transcriptional regulator